MYNARPVIHIFVVISLGCVASAVYTTTRGQLFGLRVLFMTIFVKCSFAKCDKIYERNEFLKVFFCFVLSSFFLLNSRVVVVRRRRRFGIPVL